MLRAKPLSLMDSDESRNLICSREKTTVIFLEPYFRQPNFFFNVIYP